MSGLRFPNPVKEGLPTNHPELPHVTVPMTISHFNFVLVQQPPRHGMRVISRVFTGGTSMPVWKRPRLHKRNNTAANFDLLWYRIAREANHD
jgi:hypothetical protein